MKNITIIGGGNMRMAMADVISQKHEYNVILFATKPEQFFGGFSVFDEENGMQYQSNDVVVTYSLVDAIKDADIIFCTYPAFLRKKFIKDITPYIKKNACLGFVPAYGGAEFFCNELIKKNITIFGLQKVPYVCRIVKRGESVKIMATKETLYISSIPVSESISIKEELENMLGINAEILPNYMNVTLLPGNPLLHTTGSYRYLKDYKQGTIYPNQIYYYQSWDDECSEILCKCSDEMMAICKALPIDLSGVQSIQDYYESPTPKDLTKKFHSIPSFDPLLLPMLQTNEGYIPDYSSRYYTEDIPYGLCTLKALALIANVNTPNIDNILEWYKEQRGYEYFKKDGSFGKDIKDTAIPQLFGIDNAEKLKEFYLG